MSDSTNHTVAPARHRRPRRRKNVAAGELAHLQVDSLFALRVLAHAVVTVLLSLATAHSRHVYEAGADRVGGWIGWVGHLFILGLWVAIGIALLARRLYTEYVVHRSRRRENEQ